MQVCFLFRYLCTVYMPGLEKDCYVVTGRLSTG